MKMKNKELNQQYKVRDNSEIRFFTKILNFEKLTKILMLIISNLEIVYKITIVNQ